MARRRDIKGLVRALGYRDFVTDQLCRTFDVGVAVRRDAAVALASLTAADGVDIDAALAIALRDDCSEVRTAAARALAARGDLRGVPVLADAVLDAVGPGSEAAEAMLMGLPAPEVAEQLVRMLIEREGNSNGAHGLLERVIASGGPSTATRATTAAIDGLASTDCGARSRAAQLLASLRPNTVEPLLRRLRTDVPMSQEAVLALGWRRDRRATQTLVGLLDNNDAELRRAAARALGDVADPSASGPLQAATQDDDHGVRTAALASLAILRPAAPSIDDDSSEEMDLGRSPNTGSPWTSTSWRRYLRDRAPRPRGRSA